MRAYRNQSQKCAQTPKYLPGRIANYFLLQFQTLRVVYVLLSLLTHIRYLVRLNTWWCAALGFSITFVVGLLASICVDRGDHDAKKIRHLTMYGKSSTVYDVLEVDSSQSEQNAAGLKSALMRDVAQDQQT